MNRHRFTPLLGVAALLAAGCSSTVINVVKDGAPVAGATVWANGAMLGPPTQPDR